MLRERKRKATEGDGRGDRQLFKKARLQEKKGTVSFKMDAKNYILNNKRESAVACAEVIRRVHARMQETHSGVGVEVDFTVILCVFEVRTLIQTDEPSNTRHRSDHRMNSPVFIHFPNPPNDLRALEHWTIRAYDSRGICVAVAHFYPDLDWVWVVWSPNPRARTYVMNRAVRAAELREV
ncbi:hypothetical protein CYLTODRAFT_414010 [Cylindrobasidium torrendii FP15055 ss-10]|uniref:Uncharacterized protein n=1 Tax=Cylindrobasidium torrendii FP15055 ss-10 TaxID=1314674 RepID=A0A0D7AYP8_9AGAR|nr:hypothetical protein CYLTODRAFT_414010 [Cylindrobasidium torrendii FP15055 ss-10]